MRVISGTAKGRRLVAPVSQRVRPALDKVKEAIFDILFDVSDVQVLDLFAGSGSVGIEALSRGAAEAVFVEEWLPAVTTIHKNLELCRFADRAIVMKSTVKAAIARLERKGRSFDLIFVDPPYLKNLVNPTLSLLASSSIVLESSLIVVEHHPKEPPDAAEGLTLTDSRKYGQTCVSFLKKSR
ncbi:MAG: 16S rRNA (guanine(966)-N(2))-methyltransferase RsmD [Pseudomonadota bacterium]